MVAPREIGTMASGNPGWVITTVAGTGAQGYAGDGGPAAQAILNNPFDLAFDVMGDLFFADTFNHCIRRVDGRTTRSQQLPAPANADFPVMAARRSTHC